jgi:hypothetical protein
MMINRLATATVNPDRLATKKSVLGQNLQQPHEH